MRLTFTEMHTPTVGLQIQVDRQLYTDVYKRQLADIAARQPITEFELLTVRGVGEAKARRYGDAFLDAIKDYLRDKP